jgi:hypothetical protein
MIAASLGAAINGDMIVLTGGLGMADDPEKSPEEIERDMNETLKRMHKTPPKPHKEQRAQNAKRKRPKSDAKE